MLIRYLSLFFMLMLLQSCAHRAPISSSPLKRSVQERAVSGFSQIQVKGPFNLKLRSGYRKSKIILRADPRDLPLIITEVQNNKLTITVPKGYPHYGPISAELRVKSLTSLNYHGDGTIVGKNLYANPLNLEIDNSGQTLLGGDLVLRRLKASGGGNIQISGVHTPSLQLDIKDKTRVVLAGFISLSHLDLAGNGYLAMYWLNTPNLTLCLKQKSTVQLAGIVGKLDVELWGSSRFNGRYLRAKSAFVKTHDRSIAELTAVKHQHSLATDASDIYFYKMPDTRADFMAFAGAVLDMRDWNRPDLHDYTRYNSKSSAPKVPPNLYQDTVP